MAKLLAKGERGAQRELPAEVTVPAFFGDEASVPRVKFRRKRFNPWPTILLALIALSILGTVVTFIAISQNRQASAINPNALPEIVYVQDANISLGQTANIPVEVQFPAGMPEAQRQAWQVKLGAEAPAGASYQADSQTITWTPTYKDTGRGHTIETLIVDPTSQRSNVMRFQVVVAPISSGLTQLYAWKEQTEADGTKVQIGPETTVPGMPVPFRDVTFDRVTIRAFPFNDAETAAAQPSRLEGEETLRDLATRDLETPLVIVANESLLLIANQESVSQNLLAASWLKQPEQQLPQPEITEDDTSNAND